MWNLPLERFRAAFACRYVALAAQAMTAALAAGRRSMDWAGVCMLGCITALGGGTIRDVLLGHYPLAWVQQPSLAGVDGARGVRHHPDRAGGASAELRHSWCWMRSGSSSSPWPAATSPGR